MGALWHPFSAMSDVEASGDFVVDRGEGCWIWDEAGRRYLDAAAGLWFVNVGHGRSELAEVAARQMQRLAAYHTFGDVATGPTLELADRLASIAPMDDAKVFLTSGGSDSVDTAAKLARRYWHEQGSPERRVVISRTKAYHGMHVGGTAFGGIPGNTEGYGTLMPDTSQVVWDSPDALREGIERVGPGNVAAFICEPVIGAGGVYPPPEGYLAAVRQVCREYDVLFIADEVVTGFGRIGGSWFASGRFDLDPDIVTVAKGLTSGYLPMGAVLVGRRVSEPFFAPGAGVWWRHGYTYSGHATAAAVALANLDILEKEGLLAESKRLERTLAETLAPLADHPLVTEVRAGVGALAAIQLADGALAQPAVLALRRQGVSTRGVGAGGLQVSPSFVMTDDEVGVLADATWAALDELTPRRAG
ncbi:MAG: aspartate aminotransferase family protein [Actinomycetes bacterium]